MATFGIPHINHTDELLNCPPPSLNTGKSQSLAFALLGFLDKCYRFRYHFVVTHLLERVVRAVKAGPWVALETKIVVWATHTIIPCSKDHALMYLSQPGA
jgi:hypothetical protein